VIDPLTLEELPVGEVGEIVTHGPQVFLGYWNRPDQSAQAFIEIDGKRFLRTGDLGRVDEDGYFFMVDRLKRMINASGFKVWPSEVESLMYAHPAILEACVIGARDSHRGETVKRSSCCGRNGAGGWMNARSSTGAAGLWPLIRCRGSLRSPKRCRNPAAARSSGASFKSARPPPRSIRNPERRPPPAATRVSACLPPARTIRR